VSQSTARIHLETLQQRHFEERRQRAQLLVAAALGLVLLLAALAVHALFYLDHPAQPGPFSATARLSLFVLTTGVLLVGLVFIVKSLAGAAGPGPGGDLILNPAMARVPGSEAIMESYATQYGQAAREQAARNHESWLDLRIAGWCGVAGIVGILLALTVTGLQRPGPVPGMNASPPPPREIDGACCRFEDRRVRY
jgi:NhaP-type Na+/H+ or K+/H+ antiporter